MKSKRVERQIREVSEFLVAAISDLNKCVHASERRLAWKMDTLREPGAERTETVESLRQSLNAVKDEQKITVEKPLMDSLQFDIGTWALKTFPTRNMKSLLVHLIREAKELQSTHEPVEAADCAVLLFSYAHICRFSLLDEVAKKMGINYSRKWKEPDEEGVIEHIEEETPKGSLCCDKCGSQIAGVRITRMGKRDNYHTVESREQSQAEKPPDGVCPICLRWRDDNGRCWCRGNNIPYDGKGKWEPQKPDDLSGYTKESREIIQRGCAQKGTVDRGSFAESDICANCGSTRKPEWFRCMLQCQDCGGDFEVPHEPGERPTMAMYRVAMYIDRIKNCLDIAGTDTTDLDIIYNEIVRLRSENERLEAAVKTAEIEKEANDGSWAHDYETEIARLKASNTEKDETYKNLCVNCWEALGIADSNDNTLVWHINLMRQENAKLVTGLGKECADERRDHSKAMADLMSSTNAKIGKLKEELATHKEALHNAIHGPGSGGGISTSDGPSDEELIKHQEVTRRVRNLLSSVNDKYGAAVWNGNIIRKKLGNCLEPVEKDTEHREG